MRTSQRRRIAFQWSTGLQRISVMLLGWLVVCSGSSWSQESSQPTELLTPVEFRPYRVALQIEDRDATVATARLVDQLRRELPLAIARTIGPVWELIADEVVAVRDSTAGLEKTTESDAPPTVRLETDVRFHLAVNRNSGRVQVSLRTHEPLWDYHSPTETIHSVDPRDLVAQTLPVLVRLFRPLAEWERVDDETVQLRVRGSALAISDPDLHLFRTDETYALWVVYRTREGAAQRVSPIPWTLCRTSAAADDEEDRQGLAQVFSGLRSPVARRPRGRVELWAVASRPQWPRTELELVTVATPPRQLVAHEVRISDLVSADDPPLEWKRYSDRNGRVSLEIVDSDLPVWVTIQSGHQTLARVPLLPGATPQLRIELPDDQLRLRVEGQLQLLQGELVAIVAKRRALMIACRASAKRAAWAEVDIYLKQLQSLPSITQYQEQVSGIRVPAVASARERKDVLAERRVNRLCDETLALLQRHLGDDSLRLIQEEMAELRAAANE